MLNLKLSAYEKEMVHIMNTGIAKTSQHISLSRWRIILAGAFRPGRNYTFEIYRLAVDLRLNGFIKKNTNTGFEIEIEGELKTIEAFTKKLEAHIEESAIQTRYYIMDKVLKYNEFRIINQ
jgi:acylphosphatase